MKQAEISHLTKERLALSLKKHMEKKPLEKITIRELTEDCNLNRQTFYYHFQDIYELTTWMFRQEAMELLKEKENYKSWQESLLLLLNYVDTNKAFWNHVLDSLGHANLKEIFYEDAQHIMNLILEEQLKQLEQLTVSSQYTKFLSNFYIEAISSALIDWVKGTLNLSVNELMQYLEVTLYDTLKAALQRAAHEQL